MGNVIFVPIEPMGVKTLEEYVKYLANVQAMNQDEMANLLEGRLGSINIREIAGFLVDLLTLKHKSGLVGMSAADPNNPDAVRLWSGDADINNAPWRVLQKGSFYALDAFLKGHIDAESGTIGGFVIELNKLYSTDGEGIIEGGTIRTGPVGTKRIELSQGGLKGITEDELLNGLVFQPTDTDIFDIFLYHRGAKLVEFYDNFNSYTIRGGPNSVGLFIGGDKRTTGVGEWRFTGNASFLNPINGDITGRASSANYADHAGTAAAADNLAPSGNIAWGQVLKSGSNLVHLETKNLSDLTQSSSYRTVTDGEKSAWNTKAPTVSPTFTGTPSAPTPATNDSTTKIATTAFANPGSSLAVNGYHKHPSGLIEQWGNAAIGADSTVTITLPIPFTTDFFTAIGIHNTPGNYITLNSFTLNSVTFRNNGPNAGNVYWEAKGK